MFLRVAIGMSIRTRSPLRGDTVEANTAGRMAKDKKKRDSQLVIRIHKEERDAFVELCEALDTSASREIRRFMREFVEKNTRKKK